MDDAGLIEVRLLELPVAIHQETAEHIDELLREFSLLDADSAELPARLLQLRDELEGRFSAFTAGPRDDLRQAIEDRAATIDLLYRIPATAGAYAARALGLLEEADEYCRQGSYLLTLAAPPEGARYRQWFFGQFTDQCEGAEPEPWTPSE